MNTTPSTALPERNANTSTGDKRADMKNGSTTNSEFRNFIADVEEMIIATTSLTGDDLSRAKAKLNERIVTAKKSADKMGFAIAERARQSAKATDGYVQENPWKAVGIGTAAGLLLGFLLTRR